MSVNDDAAAAHCCVLLTNKQTDKTKEDELDLSLLRATISVLCSIALSPLAELVLLKVCALLFLRLHSWRHRIDFNYDYHHLFFHVKQNIVVI